MTSTTSFERSHSIEISAPPQAVFDYVTNPQSWPEWIASSHHIDSPDRPLVTGERFHEKWHTSKPASLDWVVLELRIALDNAQLVASRSALVQRDGDVVEVDGTSSVRHGVPNGNYFLAVRHRNHLGVMKSTGSVSRSNR